MDRRTRLNLQLFLRRFRRNYEYFLQTYSGTNAGLFLDQFKKDNIKLAQTLFGDEGERLLKNFMKNIPSGN